MICILCIISSCEKEIYENHLKKEGKSSVTFREFLSETQIKNFKKQIKLKNNLTNSQGKFEEIQSHYIIDTTLVMKYIDSNLNEKYTFKIVPVAEIPDPNELYNLVYSKENDIWVYSIYILVKDEAIIDFYDYETLTKIYDSNQLNFTPTMLCFSTLYHCTRTGSCTATFCDDCLLCTTPVIDPCNDPSLAVGLYAIQDLFLANNGPSGGGGSPLTEPCTSLKNLANPQRGNIKPLIDSLTQKVTSPNSNKEFAISFKRNSNPNPTSEDDENIYTNTLINTGLESTVPIPYGDEYIGGAHNHTEKGHDMFSFGDVRVLMKAYNGASLGRKSDVVLMLVCKDNYTGVVHKYAIKVDNIDSLNNQILTKMNDPDYAGLSEVDILDRLNKKIGQKYDNNLPTLEKCFLQQFGAFGISLYKTDNDDLSNWQKLELESTGNLGTGNQLNVKHTPCN